MAGLIPLVLPGLPREVAAALVGTATGEAFRLGAPEVHGAPSFDQTDARHESGVTGAAQRGSTPRGWWRGDLDDDLVGLVAKSGFREYFHPLTGRGHGTRSFSWSAALLIHVLVGSD